MQMEDLKEDSPGKDKSDTDDSGTEKSENKQFLGREHLKKKQSWKGNI